MTHLTQVEMQCPVCDTRFRSNKVLSTNSFGGKRTDFHERAAGAQPLAHLIHMCSRCGYAGADVDFEGADISPNLKERVWSRLAPKTLITPVHGSDKYEAAALCAEWQGADARFLADHWLRAAWCCVDEQDTEAERYYRLKAVRYFTDALAEYDLVAKDERPTLTYLVGELWRRIGDTARATDWFNRVESEVTDRTTQQWVMDAARQQRDCPREWFG